MSTSIYLLVPKTYSGKKSSFESQDLDNFIIELKSKIVDCWSYEYQTDKHNGSGYKIKFDQFEKKFLKKSDFVFYIVSSKSAEPFRNSITKLLKSCKESEKLSRIIVLSLDIPVFEELNGTKIEFVYFGETWKTENANQWNVLDDMLKSKISCKLNEEGTAKTDSIPIPNSICGRRSPSKFKSFFNSLPARFESDKRRNLLSPKNDKYFDDSTNCSGQDMRLPDINISEVDNAKNENKTFTLPRKQKVDSAKLSLNSLFRRHSKKTRDSGLSIDSSTSNGSGSRKSDTIITRGQLSDEMLEGKDNQSSHNGHSPVILTSSLTKTEHHKAKIEIFKDKANKVIRSTNCLKSPNHKRPKCDVNEVMVNVVDFSSLIMTASSNIGNQSEKMGNRKNDLMALLNNRGQSEPPMDNLRNLSNDNIANRRIKYYSWNEDSSEEKESPVEELPFIDLGITDSVLNHLSNDKVMEADYAIKELEDFDQIICNKDVDESIAMLDHHLNQDENNFPDHDSTNIDDPEVFYTTFKPTNAELVFDEDKNQIDTNNSVSDVSYSTFIPSDTTKYHNDGFKTNSGDSGVSPGFEIEETEFQLSENNQRLANDPMESLDKLIKSIQISCAEKIASKQNQEYETEIMDDEENNNGYTDNLETEIVDQDETISMQHIELQLSANPPINESNLTETETSSDEDSQIEPIVAYHEMSPELIAVADSIGTTYNEPQSSIQSTCQTFIRHPIFVTGLFAATTITAPIWSSIIPRHVCLSKIFYGTLDYLFYSNIVQSIPNQIISTGRTGASVASSTWKHFIVLLPTTFINRVLPS